MAVKKKVQSKSIVKRPQSRTFKKRTEKKGTSPDDKGSKIAKPVVNKPVIKELSPIANSESNNQEVPTEQPVETPISPTLLASMPGDVQDNRTFSTEKTSVKRNWLTIGLITFIIFGLFGIGYYIAYSLGMKHGNEARNQFQKEYRTVLSPMPTTKQEIDKKKYSIQILNGSGIGGEAGKMKTLLEKEGYIISSVGNAETATFNETLIRAKRTIEPAWITSLRTLLNGTYQTDIPDELSQNESGDIIIIVGKERVEK